MLELRILNAGQTMPLYDLPALLGRRGAARELGDTIEGLINFLDDLGGDPDLEDGADDELSGDEMGDVSWTEWHTRGRHKLSDLGSEVRVRMGGCQTPLEDDEDDDPAEADGDEADGSFAEDEEAAAHRLHGIGPGCIIADSDKGADDEGETDEGV